jgi:hypothetical protein
MVQAGRYTHQTSTSEVAWHYFHSIATKQYIQPHTYVDHLAWPLVDGDIQPHTNNMRDEVASINTHVAVGNTEI